MIKFKTGLVILSIFAATPVFAQQNQTTTNSQNPVEKTQVIKNKDSAEATKAKTPEVTQKKSDEMLIDINSASVEELSKLNGIGAVRSEAIVKGRPYKGKDDLLSKKIIPENVYNEIKDKIIAKQK